MVTLGVCAQCIRLDLDSTPGAVDRLRNHDSTYALREVCKVWEHLWDKRSRIFTPVVAGKTVESVLCKDGGKSNVIEGITDCIVLMFTFATIVTR